MLPRILSRWTRVGSRFLGIVGIVGVVAAVVLPPLRPAFGQVEGGTVVDGAATITPLPSGIEVMQQTDRAVINWDSFSLSAGQTANFLLPGASSAVLNRVVTPNLPSEIFGTINSNGNVYLINPAGILIGPSGVINTNGFTASALDIPNAEFMRGGNLHFRSDGQTPGAVINQGTIYTRTGGAALIGGDVANQGTITSEGGSITMAVGDDVTLTAAGKYIQADMPTLLNGVSEYAGVINQTGVVRAVGAAQIGGEVYLVNPNGKVLEAGLIAAQKRTTDGALAGGDVVIEGKQTEAAGTIDATGSVGGKVTIMGDDVKLAGATIDASGDAAGGVVLVGGGVQGQDASVKNATSTAVDADSSIRVDARVSGDAGTAVVYSTNNTAFAGLATARALGAAGNGGFVEVSGAQILSFQGFAETSSVGGLSGVLLLDPTEFDINAGAGLSTPNSIGATTLATLLGGNNVVIATGVGVGNGDIRVNSDVAWNSANSLALLAHGNIRAGASVQNSGSGNVTLVAGWDGTTGAPGVTGASINTVNVATFLATPTSYGNTADGGNVFIGNGSQAAGIAVGGRNGTTTVLANDVTLRGSDSSRAFAQLGFRHVSGGAAGSTQANGAISVYAKGDVGVVAGGLGPNGGNPSSYAQIGHGGWRGSLTNFQYLGDVLLTVGGGLNVAAAAATEAYAQIGHGGLNGGGNHQGTLTLAVQQAAALTAGDASQAYAQIGHGGVNADGQQSGNIVLDLFDTFTVAGGDGNNAYAQIGHGGLNNAGDKSGLLDIQVTGLASFTGGPSSGAYVQVGHGGDNADGQQTGDLTLELLDALIISGGDGNNAYAQIGHGGLNNAGNKSGLLDIQVTGQTSFMGGPSSGAYVQLGHGGNNADGELSGDITLNVFDALTVSGAAGNSAYAQIGHGGLNNMGNKSGLLDIQAAGAANFTGGASSGAYVQVGHGGDNADGDSTGAMTLQFGAALQFVAGDGNGAYAQIGHGGSVNDGNWSGAIQLTTTGDAAIAAATNVNAYAKIGHGGRNSDGDTTSDITLQIGGALQLNAAVGNTAFVQVGHGGPDSLGTLGGALTVTTVGGLSLTSVAAADAYSQIGHGGHNGDGTMSGKIDLAVGGDLTAIGVAADRWALIGHGGTTLSNSTVSGDIEVEVDGGASFTHSVVGHRTLTVGGYSSGNTFVGVGQGSSNTGAITSDSASLFNSAATGQLRFYMPDRNSYQIAAGTLLNGTAGVAPGTVPLPNEQGDFAFATGPYAPTVGNYGVYFNLAQILIKIFASGSSVYGDFGNPTIPLNYTLLSGTLDVGDTLDTIGLNTNVGTVVSNTTGAGVHLFDVLDTTLNSKYVLDPTSYGEWTVTPATLTINANAQTKVFGSPDPTLTFGVSGLQNTDTLAVITGGLIRVAGEDVGLYAINQGTLNAGPNYTIAYTGANLDITPAPLTITALNQTKTYGDSFTFNGVPGTFGADVTVGGLQNADAITNIALYTLGGDATSPTTGVGNYTITADVPSGITGNASFKASNYNITFNNGNFRINRANLTIFALLQSKVYGDAFTFDTVVGSPGADVAATGLKNGEIPSITLFSNAVPQTADAGAYGISVTSVANNGSFNTANYNIRTSGSFFFVLPAPLYLTATDQAKFYGDTFVFAPGPGVNSPLFTVSGLKNADQVDSVEFFSLGAGPLAPVALSPYAILPYNPTGTNFKPSNYTVIPILGQLTVNPAVVTVTALDQSKLYGDTFVFNGVPGSVGADVTVVGMKNGQTVTSVELTSAATAPTTPVGVYDIDVGTISGTFNPSNYVFVREKGDFTIAPAPLTLIAHNQYKPTDFTFLFNGATMFTPIGLRNGETIASVTLSSPGAPAGSPFGVYPIFISNPTGGTAVLSNYAITLQPGALVVGNSLNSFVYDQFTRYEYYRESIETLPTGGMRYLGNIIYGQSPGAPGSNLSSLNSFQLFNPAPPAEEETEE